jgi:hypothetical protein
MQVFRGKGKIYDRRGGYLDEITYELFFRARNGTGTEWWGEIIPEKGIMPVGKHMIELEDRRRGTCETGVNTYSSFELVVDSFSVKGTGPLEN